jgi:NADPH:quinone reductase-like Zn-dependent oxidoreductase
MTRVARFHEYGDANVLRIEIVDVPAPATDEVQIAVKAIGLKCAEVMYRTGRYQYEAVFPSQLGYEAAGTVKQQGAAVTGVAESDAVSVATTRTRDKARQLLDAGARHVIATSEEDLAARAKAITEGKCARVVFDPIGGPAIAQFAECMVFGGILLEYGALSTDDDTFPQFALLGKCLTFKGYLYTEVTTNDALLEQAKALINQGLESGELVPLISRTYKFDEIQDATRFLESNEQVGKIVVTVD